MHHAVYCYYGCCVYTLLAKGYVDAALERRFGLYDSLGLVPVLEGYGLYTRLARIAKCVVRIRYWFLDTLVFKLIRWR